MGYIFLWTLLVLGPLVVAIIVMADTLDRRAHREFMDSIDTLSDDEKARLKQKAAAYVEP